MTHPPTRSYLFLQGPPGPLFLRLAEQMQRSGTTVHRINFNGGDHRDWPIGAIDFRGRFSDWPVFLDNFLRTHGITDLLLFGDCRPYHLTAHGIAAARNVRMHVLEEGYIRPDWMTLEPEGVNARSKLSRDKNWFLAEASRLPPEPELPPITASFKRRARDSYWYYHYVCTGRLRYPHFQPHRTTPIIKEGIGWLWKFARERRATQNAQKVLARLDGKPMFLMPLQLSGDYQIRAHSPFPDMQSAAGYTIHSFAAHAPREMHLLLKAHPLDCSMFDWEKFTRRQARSLGLEGRLHFVDGGDLQSMVKGARGLVCVNSTSATLALSNGTPVCTLGDAIYDIKGLTHQGHLDSFWSNPSAPASEVYAAFRRVIVDRCLVRGGLASESAVSVLIDSMLERLSRSDASASDQPVLLLMPR